jgi:anti-sigma factor RsiW
MTASFRDVELLSAYLDGQLNPSDSARLESRLASDPSLRAVLDDLREARGLLRQLPSRRAPHSFTLTPKMAGLTPPEPRAYPALRFAAALSTLLFLLTFVVNGLSPLVAPRFASAPAPAYGVGGGSGGGNGGAPETVPQEAPAPTEALAQPFAAAALPTPTTEALSAAPLPPASDHALVPTLGPNAKSIAPELGNRQPLPVQHEAPVSLVWEIGLAVIAVTCGAAAWLLRLTNAREIRKRWDKK